MIASPTIDEWDTTQLSEGRRTYLESKASFSSITCAALNEAELLKWWIEPYRTPPKGVSGAKQYCFLVRVTNQTYDLFYNSSDGIRGRYWRSLRDGENASHYFIDAILPKILRDAAQRCAIQVDEALRSTSASSTKVWVREMDGAGRSMISIEARPQLSVARWIQNESEVGSKGRQWRWTPYSNELEIKGALIDQTGAEHIPASKVDRSFQIHRYGFT
ncbi:MAG TPA: hypothetical protein VIJ67_03275 [Pseudolabrys sp.]